MSGAADGGGAARCSERLGSSLAAPGEAFDVLQLQVPHSLTRLTRARSAMSLNGVQLYQSASKCSARSGPRHRLITTYLLPGGKYDLCFSIRMPKASTENRCFEETAGIERCSDAALKQGAWPQMML